MKRFSFPLDRVLAWRRLQAEQERAILDRLVGQAEAIGRRSEEVRSARRSYEQSLSRALHFDAVDVVTLPHWQAQLKKSLGILAAEQQQVQQRVEQQRAKVREAERVVMLLERLRDRRLQAWQKELAREEETFAAEAYLAGCIRLKTSTRQGA